MASGSRDDKHVGVQADTRGFADQAGAGRVVDWGPGRGQGRSVWFLLLGPPNCGARTIHSRARARVGGVVLCVWCVLVCVCVWFRPEMLDFVTSALLTFYSYY